MKNIVEYCDHIVYCCNNLKDGIERLQKLCGIIPKIGGRHLTKGTHNALFKIGPNAYFEILAVDHENKEMNAPRWMGIDLIDHPKITRWAIKSNTIKEQAQILTDYRLDYGQIQAGSRALSDGTQLTWKLTDPLSHPEIEVVPFLLDWENSIHPSVQLEQHASLKDIELFHPNPSVVQQTLNKLYINISVQQQDQPHIKVTLETPNGMITI